MRRALRLATVAIIVSSSALPAGARDPAPSVPPALGEPAEGDEPSAGSNPEAARDRFQTETVAKSDELLAKTVGDTLRSEGRFAMVSVGARDGVARLSGVVATPRDRSDAVGVARGVPGVRDVADDLRVGARDDAR